MIDLLINGRFYTDLAGGLTCQAIALCNGRIIATGSTDEISSLYQRGMNITDLNGLTVLPGLVDSHIHFQHYAESLTKVNCETATIDACLIRVQQQALKTLPAGWVLGHGWNQNSWDGLFGTRQQLDAVAEGHPVYLTAKSLHAAWCNSKALAVAGITNRTPDPTGGMIQRDEHGEPTGILLESAMYLVESIIPTMNASERLKALFNAQAILNRVGLTGIHDFDGMTCFSSLAEILSEHALTLRVVKNIPRMHLAAIKELSIPGGYGDPMLRLGCLKLFSDGALGPHTAAMLSPYEGSSETGSLLLEEEEILAIGIEAASIRLPLAVHAIGDLAVRTTLRSLKRLVDIHKQGNINMHPYRIEHLQLITPEDLPLLVNSGITASMQPYHLISDQPTAEKYWGTRNNTSYAWKTVLDTGVNLAFGSDAPVEAPDPYAGIIAAITRRPEGFPEADGWYPSERLNVRQAFLAYTYGAATAAGMQHESGRIAPGMFADLAFYQEDPVAFPDTILPAMETIATMVSGNWVWKGF
jgi:predicted amidohydrolase YtcJ